METVVGHRRHSECALRAAVIPANRTVLNSVFFFDKKCYIEIPLFRCVVLRLIHHSPFFFPSPSLRAPRSLRPTVKYKIVSNLSAIHLPILYRNTKNNFVFMSHRWELFSHTFRTLFSHSFWHRISIARCHFKWFSLYRIVYAILSLAWHFHLTSPARLRRRYPIVPRRAVRLPK